MDKDNEFKVRLKFPPFLPNKSFLKTSQKEIQVAIGVKSASQIGKICLQTFLLFTCANHRIIKSLCFLQSLGLRHLTTDFIDTRPPNQNSREHLAIRFRQSCAPCMVL